MERYEFKIGENPETGKYGVKSTEGLGSDEAEFFAGMGIAHDIFEHNFEGDDGRAHFEYMAMGFALFIRYEGNVKHMWGLNQTVDSTTGLFFDGIHSFLMNREYIDRTIPEAPKVPEYYQDLGSYSLDVETTLREYIEINMDHFIIDRNEDEYYDSWVTFWNDEYNQDFATYCDLVEDWINYGYYLAHKKYSVDHNLSSWEVGQMQDKLYEIGERFAEEYANESYHGETFYVNVDFETQRVWIDEPNMWDYEDEEELEYA